MAGVFSVLGLLAYLFLLIDWKDLRGTLAKGGWVSAVLYIGLAILITAVVTSSPDVMTAAPIHHG